MSSEMVSPEPKDTLLCKHCHSWLSSQLERAFTIPHLARNWLLNPRMSVIVIGIGSQSVIFEKNKPRHGAKVADNLSALLQVAAEALQALAAEDAACQQEICQAGSLLPLVDMLANGNLPSICNAAHLSELVLPYVCKGQSTHHTH